MAARFTIKQLRTHHVGPLDLELNDGECVAISGPSGAGKTLLLRALADLDAHEGDVLLNGESSTQIKAHLWRQRVGLLPAESQWWGERIGDHFAAVEPVLLEELGFGAEVMDWEVSRCSTGERQRLALLRLLQNKPDVLLLDEPTASLDAENTGRVEGLIAKQCRQQGTAVIWISHDPSQAQRVASRRLKITDGQLTEAG